MDNYLVTGGTGFLGLNFLNHNSINNIFLLGHKKILKKKNKNILYLDKYSKKNLIQIILDYQIKVIIHAAAITDIEFAEKNKLKTYNTNFRLTKTISDIVKELQIKIVYISTDQIYDSDIGYSKENAVIRVPNYYSLTKYNAEKYIKKNNKNYWILRSSFFGWGNRYKNTLVDFIYSNLKKKQNIFLWKNIYFNPLYVSEIIDISIKIVNHRTGIYNLGTKTRFSKLEFGLLLCKKLKLNSKYIHEVNYSDFSVRRPKDMSVNIEKISNIFPNKSFNLEDHLNYLVCDFSKIRKFLMKY
jgi:dTDP-4-dehydrorhamnose reductase